MSKAIEIKFSVEKVPKSLHEILIYIFIYLFMFTI